MKSAFRATSVDEPLAVFLARYERTKTVDPRKYRVRESGDYFKKWESTGWDTVKRFALWTKDVKEAAELTLDDWEKGALSDLRAGFARMRLELVRS